MRYSISILLILFFATIGLYAQTETKNKDLVLSSPELTEQNVVLIGKQIKALDGAEFKGYFSQAHAILITYNPAKILDEEILLVLLRRLNDNIPLEILKGETIFSILDRYTVEPPGGEK